MDTQREMGICELELRKQDVIGEQWSRDVCEDAVMLVELDLQRPARCTPAPGPSAAEAGPDPLPRPSLLGLFLSSQCPAHPSTTPTQKRKSSHILSEVSSTIWGGN